MSRVDFVRDDFRVRIEFTPGRLIALQLGSAPPRYLPQLFAGRSIANWVPDASEIAEALGPLPELQAWLQATPQVTAPSANWRLIRRVVLDIRHHVLSALPWEQVFAPIMPPYGRILVRSTAVLPRHGAVPFTLPMRILQIGNGGDRPIDRMIRHVFGTHPAASVAEAVAVGACSIEQIPQWRETTQWPTAEILHFDDFPWSDALLSTEDPEFVGSLGWLARLTGTWQTRLVVLHCKKDLDAAYARMLADALAARGGPAVLVADLGDLTPGWYYRELYGKLVHDYPLDDCVFPRPMQEASGRERRPTLVGGGGREESLRFSTLGQSLVELAGNLKRKDDVAAASIMAMEALIQRTAHESRSAKLLSGTTQSPAMADVQHELEQLSTAWYGWSFEFHEHDGVLPLAEKLGALRRAAGVTGPVRPEVIAPSTDPGRFVNAQFARATSEGYLQSIPQYGDELRVGDTYQLDVDIGPKNVSVRTVGSVPIVEEHFEWTEGTPGIWLEIGVTGINFEVLGDPVQEVWLPRHGPSARATFAVVPRTDGVAQLRFCVYHRDNIIQSFRIAACTSMAGGFSNPIGLRAGLLADALELPEKMVDETAWLARMEYALAPGIQDAVNKPRRGLSIVANSLDGRTIVTLKGRGQFRVRDDIGDASETVTHVRQQLQEVSEKTLKLTNEVKQTYLFGLPGMRNAGDEERLKPALKKLAEAGYDLFDEVIPGDEAERDETLDKLFPDGDTIHVAQIHLAKVIPWAAMYCRRYDAGQQEAQVDGVKYPVAHEACLAALPGADGKFPSAPCGALASCVLHPAQVAARLAADGKVPVQSTVACPRFFLGFRHILELPPKQVEAEEGRIGPLGTSVAAEHVFTRIDVAGSARLAAGYNAELNLAPEHEKALVGLLAGPPVRAVSIPSAYSRDDVLQALQDNALDLIYLFCHARGGPGTGVKPQLEFQPKGGIVGSFSAPQVPTVTWSHHPLVILNGCNTVGFSPSTLSPFIRKFVHDCKASGVIGTEVPVFEELATEFAETFLARFLEGESAGEALLHTRRALLSQYNPLGLVYTLYAAADLHIKTPA